MKKIELRNERGVLKLDDKKMRDYLKNIELIAWINNDSVEYTILNRNEVDYIFSSSEYHLIEDGLTEKLNLLSQSMSKYLSIYDSIESSVCYDLSFENLSSVNSSHQKIKNTKGELIFEYKRFEPNQRKRSKLESDIHKTIIEINNIIVRLLFDAFNQREID